MKKQEADKIKLKMHEFYNSIHPLLYDIDTDNKWKVSKRFDAVIELIDELVDNE